MGFEKLLSIDNFFIIEIIGKMQISFILVFIYRVWIIGFYVIGSCKVMVIGIDFSVYDIYYNIFIGIMGVVRFVLCVEGNWEQYVIM